MRVFLSCLVCRIVTFVLHKLGRGATSMPGKVALKVKRNVLKDLSENTKVIVVRVLTVKPRPAVFLKRDLKRRVSRILSINRALILSRALPLRLL